MATSPGQLEPPEAGRAGRALPWGLQRERGAAHSWILDFWPPDSKRMHFWCGQPPVCVVTAPRPGAQFTELRSLVPQGVCLALPMCLTTRRVPCGVLRRGSPSPVENIPLGPRHTFPNPLHAPIQVSQGRLTYNTPKCHPHSSTHPHPPRASPLPGRVGSLHSAVFTPRNRPESQSRGPHIHSRRLPPRPTLVQPHPP